MMRAVNVWGFLFGVLLVVSVARAEESPVYKIKLGVSPVVSSAGIFVAYEKGYFKAQGLDIDMTYFKSSGAPMTVLLGSNGLDVGAGNISAGLWTAIAGGLDIRLVADKGRVSKECDYIGLLVRKDLVDSKKYNSFMDLKGMKMAVTALGVSQQIAADRFLKSAGLSSSDVTFDKMDYATMNLALQNKELDATVQLEPYLTQAVQQGIAVKVAGVNEVYPGQQSAAVIYAAGFIKEHPALAEKFMIAYLQGARDYNDGFIKGKNKNEIIALLKKHIKIENDELWNTMIPSGIDPDGLLDTTSLKADVQWYQDHGFITTPVDVEKAVDNTFVEKALGSLGKYN